MLCFEINIFMDLIVAGLSAVAKSFGFLPHSVAFGELRRKVKTLRRYAKINCDRLRIIYR
ncbi:hypothetical protein GCM10011403_07350 [Pseudohongiella nitratireducens]|uniref:Uncharacterized protein n=1 Tax=Pseudohongiella nitratireducens TaxID=1768907 RepID=A0A917LR52_9GAMM|nr:hypothetical protein GCM10011403_07350 [Pseudohongiella nitratireducens]